MSYLILSDFNRLISDLNVQQLISGNELIRTQAQLSALEEVKSYLTVKYDVDAEFTDTLPYSHTAVTYTAGSRVYINAGFYNDKKTYSLNDQVLYQGNVYVCTTAIPVAEEFTTGHWLKLGPQYAMFYGVYPKPVFDITTGQYKIGDLVYWKGKIYSCLIATVVIDHLTYIQYSTTNAVPYQNVLPDDPVSGTKYWSVQSTYSIALGQILNTDKFTPGDNRSQLMVMYMLDVIIYHMYRRIPPQVIPEERKNAYKAAIAWLYKVASGDEIVANLTKRQPSQGNSVRFGSRTKMENYF